MKFLRYIWASPITLVGLALAAIVRVTGGVVQMRGGVIETWGGWPGRLLRGGRFFRGGAATTLGHVILARNAECMERSRQHELEHVRQFEQWGPLLLPAYGLIFVWLKIRGGDPYLDHPLEPPPK